MQGEAEGVAHPSLPHVFDMKTYIVFIAYLPQLAIDIRPRFAGVARSKTYTAHTKAVPPT